MHAGQESSAPTYETLELHEDRDGRQGLSAPRNMTWSVSREAFRVGQLVQAPFTVGTAPAKVTRARVRRERSVGGAPGAIRATCDVSFSIDAAWVAGHDFVFTSYPTLKNPSGPSLYPA